MTTQRIETGTAETVGLGAKHESLVRAADAPKALTASLVEALERIANWKLPPSGAFYEDGKPVSYGAAFGSNGERDYFRNIARQALALPHTVGETGLREAAKTYAYNPDSPRDENPEGSWLCPEAAFIAGAKWKALHPSGDVQGGEGGATTPDALREVRDMLENIQLHATNHGGWVENNPMNGVSLIHDWATKAILALTTTPNTGDAKNGAGSGASEGGEA